ncbi:2Fe-2S ferredoxin-like protein [Alteromonas sediminis]|uniref:2Fe-2S ferredoxin-like protein n=1 Tax=Alteromonas sediminis TaxID=2259342 RepID=A0A3N5Y117_9ALTE|nr:class I ribonucleotide reductase maintenance protein YfaE [Alteromonas sediminis]RPJ67457.1 2Fe-2S ferredoxin-like protein [Alteromonas sediminis]
MTKPDGNLTIHVVDGEAISTSHDETILETLEKANIDMLFHCREGFCGACRSRLIKGEVEYTTDPLAFIDDDEILPCCCKAASDIEIEINQ